MDFVITIGGKIGEYMVAPIGRQFGYLFFYNRNVKNLKAQVDELKNIKNGLQPKLDAAERNGENITVDVQRWLDEVNKTSEDTKTFYEEEKMRYCWSRYSVSRKAKKMTQDVVVVLQQKGQELISRQTIAHAPPPGRLELATIGGESSRSGVLKEVLETLKDDNINMIGIYGMDGVGMTRLLKNVKRSAKADNQFDEVAIAVVSKEGSIRNVQGEIADRLGLKFIEETLAGRADRLYGRLVDNKKKLILLDNVCEILDLEAIGIPFGEVEENKRCKIIMTSPSKRVCQDMNTHKNLKMKAENATFQLFGGPGGAGVPWDDQTHTTIRSIVIVFNENGICSLKTEYDDNGHSSWSSDHDFRRRSEHDNPEKIVLKHPDEFLIFVSGYYESAGGQHVGVHSLKFESNKQTFGPFGLETGQHFASPPDVGKIVGFHGRSSSDSLDAIGLYYEPKVKPTVYERIEVCGGSGGYLFDDGPFTTIRKLLIVFDNVMNSIHIEYDDNGRSVWSNVHGSSGGTHYPVKLDHPGEFLISISGYFRAAPVPENCIVIGSLKIQTNRNVYGPFGEERGTPFSFPSSCHGKIIGFHGHKGGYIDSLGTYIEPFPDPNHTAKIDPFGGIGGSLWDDGAFTTIRQIKLQFSHAIIYISIEYDKDGRSEWSSHGNSTTHPASLINLDYPGEFLISMSGTTRLIYTWRVINSLAFQSNRRTYGPFGNESGQPFSTSPSTSGKIVGFHGRIGAHLDSIGAHFETL